jgi:hypothetical protein
MRPHRRRRWTSAFGTLAAAAVLIGGAGCGGGTSHPAPPSEALTLTWDQPDELAQYFMIRSGIQLVRTDQRVITLYLARGTHAIEVQACNSSGCSEPARVTVTWGDGGWEMVRVAARGG